MDLMVVLTNQSAQKGLEEEILLVGFEKKGENCLQKSC